MSAAARARIGAAQKGALGQSQERQESLPPGRRACKEEAERQRGRPGQAIGHRQGQMGEGQGFGQINALIPGRAPG